MQASRIGVLHICHAMMCVRMCACMCRFVDMPQFVDIVEAEEVRAHSRFSKSLRSMARGTSKWWTEMPSSIDQY